MGYVEDIRKLVGNRPLILVGAVAVLIDKKGRLLLEQRKFPEDTWGLPGGLMELGESTEDTARREVQEETGLVIGELRLINIYSGPEHFVVAQNGDQFYVVTAAYWTDEWQGELHRDDLESVDLKFFKPSELPGKMIGSHLTIVQDFLHKTKE
ncbi:MAG TPA: NUDIX hydrolase [Planococcus sp. (in: firmicutes)]|nr:NUDIX hydrolase [Planococcus sp. (in: firmicutes)]